jgi:hypothetical protein
VLILCLPRRHPTTACWFPACAPPAHCLSGEAVIPMAGAETMKERKRLELRSSLVLIDLFTNFVGDKLH